MAARVELDVQDPQDVIDTYGTGALIRIERDTVVTFATATEIATVAVVAGRTEYEHRDQTGVAGTHWYRSRYSKASPSAASDYSGYSAPFKAGDPGGQVIALETAKTWANMEGAADDGWLALAVGAVNRSVIRGIGVDLGPSPDTTRTYDAVDATDSCRRISIPGGIRAFVTVEVSTDGLAWTDATSDVRIGPLIHSRPYGEPGAYIEVAPYSTTLSSFHGWYYVRITGTAFQTFGWDAYPEDLVHVATVALQRMMAERSMGGANPTESTASRYLKWDAATIAHYRAMYFPMAA
jgi:hypothetical protein